MKKISLLLVAVITLTIIFSINDASAKYIRGYGDCDSDSALQALKAEKDAAKEANTAPWQVWSNAAKYGPADWATVNAALPDSADLTMENGAFVDDDVRAIMNNVNWAAVRARGLMSRGCGSSKQTNVATLSDSARVALRMQFCKADLMALKDTCDLMDAADVPQSQVQAYRKIVWARMDSTIQVQLAIQAGNASIRELAAKLEEQGYHFGGGSSFNPDDYNLVNGDSLLALINTYDGRFAAMDERVSALETWKTDTEERLANFATEDWVVDNFEKK